MIGWWKDGLGFCSKIRSSCDWFKYGSVFGWLVNSWVFNFLVGVDWYFGFWKLLGLF